MAKPVFGNTACPADKKEKPNENEKKNAVIRSKHSSFKIPLKACQKQPCPEEIAQNFATEKNPSSVYKSAQICQSLISPKTLLNGTMAPLLRHGRKSVTAEAAPSLSTSVVTNCVSPQNNNSSLILCSTTVSCFSNLSPPNWASKTEAMLGSTEKEEGAELLVETEERCGSYDDMVLEGDVNEANDECDAEYMSEFDSGSYDWLEQHTSHSAGSRLTLNDDMRESTGKSSKMQKITTDSTSKGQKSHCCILTAMNNRTTTETMHSVTSDIYFAVPKTVNIGKSNQCNTGLRTSLQLHKTSYVPTKNCSIRPNPFVPEKTSTPNTSFARPKPAITQIPKHKDTLRSSFTIYTEPTKQATAPLRPSSHGSVLSSLSTNALPSRADRSIISVRGAQKITSPLCACGRRAKRQVVSNGGPNHGRGFYCCPVRRSGSGGRMEKGCEFFKWESAVMKSASAAAPAVGSSVSLCQLNSTVSHRPAHTSLLRKSY